jgi:hypothetical protein
VSEEALGGAPRGLRYQSLAGRANPGLAWQTWERGDASFVPDYIDAARDAGQVPVFSYYMLLQSTPEGGSEEERVREGLRDPEIMRAWFEDLQVFFERASEAGGLVVLHLEPDLWGFMQLDDSNPARVDVEVKGTGLPELEAFGDTAAGMAQAIVRLRDTYAPNVALAYHFSAWATGTDPFLRDTGDSRTRRIADDGARFYLGLGAEFDLAFTEFSDRDAGFKEAQYGDGGASWWDADDFARHVLLLESFHQATGLPLVLWQIPYGNTKMRALDNSWNHYQDNRVEWLLDDPGWSHLGAYRDAGVAALLFGRGADGATDASDAAGDGVTDPEPINGNTRPSLSAADDGGYFAERAGAYYDAGPLALSAD